MLPVYPALRCEEQEINKELVMNKQDILKQIPIDIGDGLTLRWATIADNDQLVELPLPCWTVSSRSSADNYGSSVAEHKGEAYNENPKY